MQGIASRGHLFIRIQKEECHFQCEIIGSEHKYQIYKSNKESNRKPHLDIMISQTQGSLIVKS